MADAAGLNSFVRQVGGSVGLTIFATIFTNFAIRRARPLASHVTVLRPEMADLVSSMKASMMAHGMTAGSATAAVGRFLYGQVAVQGTVIGFNRVFLLQGGLPRGHPLPLLPPCAAHQRAGAHRDARGVATMATNEKSFQRKGRGAPARRPAMAARGRAGAGAPVATPAEQPQEVREAAYLILGGLAGAVVAIYYSHDYLNAQPGLDRRRPDRRRRGAGRRAGSAASSRR